MAQTLRLVCVPSLEEEIARERASHSGSTLVLRRSAHAGRQEIVGFEDGVTHRGEPFYYLRLA